jgi:hypothetical protein
MLRTLPILLLVAVTACGETSSSSHHDADAAPPSDGGITVLPGLDMGLDPADAEVELDAEVEPDLAPEPDMALEPDAAPVDVCEQWSGLRDRSLLDALHETLHDTYTPLELRARDRTRYNTARARMFTRIEFVRVGDQQGQECVYTGDFFRSQEGIPPDDEDLNVEHVWPRSRMESDRNTRLYAHQESDMHHLMPAVPGANALRSSLPFGEVNSDRDGQYAPSYEGRDRSGDRVFEPRDVRKGDVARMVMYFSVRWGRGIGGDEARALKAWHQQDPVDARERRRNDLVEDWQGNRNPFVDCPSLVNQVSEFRSFGILDREGDLPGP